jgi:hypothetical protein
MLKRYELGANAIEFIRSELSQGRDLAASIAELPLETGTTATYLPESLGTVELGDFGSGGVASGDENRKLAELIEEYLGRGAERICAFEHPAARKGDRRSPGVSFFTVGVTVFLFATGTTPRGQIEVAAREAHWYPAIGILSSLSRGDPPVEHGSEQPASLLVKLVERTDHLLIGAYDGEGWLIWSRPGAALGA